LLLKSKLHLQGKEERNRRFHSLPLTETYYPAPSSRAWHPRRQVATHNPLGHFEKKGNVSTNDDGTLCLVAGFLSSIPMDVATIVISMM
jgi:hypothetical protein